MHQNDTAPRWDHSNLLIGSPPPHRKVKKHAREAVEYLPAFGIVTAEEGNLQPEFLGGAVRAAS